MTHHRLLPLLCALCLLTPALASAQESVTTVQPQDAEAVEKERYLFKGLVARMCSILNQSQRDDYAEMPYEIENQILTYNGWSRDTPDYRQRVSEFWNEHNNDLICPENHRYIKQHFFVRVVDMQLYEPVLNKYFLNSNDEGTENLYSIDVNAYQILWREVDGEIIERKITMLDFIDELIDDPEKGRFYNTTEIKSLRRLIINYYGAKKGSELPDED